MGVERGQGQGARHHVAAMTLGLQVEPGGGAQTTFGGACGLALTAGRHLVGRYLGLGLVWPFCKWARCASSFLGFGLGDRWVVS